MTKKYRKLFFEKTYFKVRSGTNGLTPLDFTSFFYIYGILESWNHVGVGGGEILLPGLTWVSQPIWEIIFCRIMLSHISICKGFEEIFQTKTNLIAQYIYFISKLPLKN